MSTNSGIEFATPKLPSISLVDIEQLDNNVEYALSERPYPSYPPLRLSQILQLIKNGSADAITLIEWLSVFNDDFDAMDSGQQNEACILLWKAIAENPRVAGLALHMAANRIADSTKKFPECLISTMDIAENVLVGQNKLKVSWLIGLRENDYLRCIATSITAGYSPLSFSNLLNLPELGRFREGIVSAFVPYIDSSFAPEYLNNLDCCITDMTESEKIVTYDALLKTDENILTYFDYSIQRRCLPDSDDTLWYDLSHFSRDVLGQRFEVGGYYALKALIDKLCLVRNVKSLGLADKDVRQLRSRIDFWSNYSDNLSQVRLLIPASTAKSIGVKIDNDSSDIIVLPNLNKEDVEVCVFELRDKIIIEVLRGPASEIRIFDSTPRNQTRLLKDKQLTLKKLRTMACETIFDHAKLWQYFLEKRLRADFDIHPNKNITIFNGMGSKYGKYNRESGLPKPKNTEISERAEQLDAWNKTFWIREALIKKLQPNALLVNGWKEMQLAELAILQGKTKEFNTLVDKATNYDNSAAMCLKAVSVFSSKSPTFNQWKEAEELVSNAIKKGYEPAKALISKYNLKIEIRVSRSKGAQLDSPTKIAKNKETIPFSIAKKIFNHSDRPYSLLQIDELEVLCESISSSQMKDAIIWELSFRSTKKRNTALLNRLKAM